MLRPYLFLVLALLAYLSPLAASTTPYTVSTKAQGALTCAYPDLAMKRGFAYWTVMYPTEDNEVLVLGLSNSATSSPQDIFGSALDVDRLIGTEMSSVEKFAGLCGIRQ